MVRVQADPLLPLREWLQDRTSGVDVRRDVPNGWTVDATPLLILGDDGGPLQWPIMSRHTIRVTGWGVDRVATRAMTALAVGQLHGARLPGLRISSSSSAILEARDKATGAWLQSALMTIGARTMEVG